MKRVIAALLLCLGVVCTAEAGTNIEVGAGMLNWKESNAVGYIVSERFAGKYDISIGLMEGQECDCYDFNDPRIKTKIDPLLLLYAQRVFTSGRFEFGIGFGFFSRQSRVSTSILMVPLSIRVRTYKNLYVGIRHFSNGGSAEVNLGQDILTLGWNF